MALGEEKAEVEASAAAKALSYGQWSCREQEADTPGLTSGEQEQPALPEPEGGFASPGWGTEGPPAPACCDGAGPSPSGAYQPQANSTRRESVAGRSKPALGCLPPPPAATGHRLHSVESQGAGSSLSRLKTQREEAKMSDLLCQRSVPTEMEETRLSASEELPQTLTDPRATDLCSGHEADTEDDPSPVESPRVLDLSQQPQRSGFPFPTRWRSVVSQGAAAPPFSSCSVSASSPGSSLQGHQDEAEAQSCSIAKVSSSLELVVPQSAPSVVGPGPRLQWPPQPASSGVDAPGLGRRHLSFQAEYWACVLPDSLPPSPDRHSPLWNPNKEYEDLLDYTYPLRPKPHLPKHLDSHKLADPILQDSGVDLDSFSVSPASTLKFPTNGSQNCPSAEASALPFSRPREPSLMRWPSGAPQKQCSVGLASCNQLTSTPRASGGRDAPWESREPAQRYVKDWLPMDKRPEEGSPQLRTCDRGWPLPRTEREKGASQGGGHPACTESRWKPEEEVESDDEYLALPARLTQVSSLVSCLGSSPTLVTLPTGSAEGQTSLNVSDSDGPASLPSDSSQSHLPSGAALRGSRGPEGQNHRLLCSFVRARGSAGEGGLGSSQALGVSSGPLTAHSSLPAVWDQRAFLAPDGDGQPPGKGEPGKESLVQCVETFCCQLEELIGWLYNIADVTDHLIPSKSNLTGLKSSLQLYRQFKKDIDEHQSLTESVLQKGEILLQCLLDSTPVLKDVLGRISKQPSELESHADRLYDAILASLDMLAGCTLIPDHTTAAHGSTDVKGISLASSQAEM
ncbi:centrosomal protein of 68 kDa isoform X1 [Hyaena hyaena]|uniref:centrosomal protein of 68 kDa isoform X1 n=1 Tax=Hyaena hyaena TaxID=95912 RepID=UPI001924CA66|nr:centrosomal protein of 68 kDa isoform X1 [Hyaena hyaena]XP_039099072.1 centrosomal protein of 68 kDa isoform X1 [Hyaena hyaena]XP_039099074.1 centrosomal protein of 68 kDa isoform X1 [Hyaena hyaena]